MSRKPPMRLLIGAGFLLATLANVFGGDAKVIANVSVKADSISSDELRGVFLLQRKTLKDGSPVVPVLQKGGATHEAFLRQYLNRDAQEIRIYYEGLIFTGKGSMPKEVNSDAEAVLYVARTRGAIGYVDSAANTEQVKVLFVIPEGRSSERTLLTRVEPAYPETLQRLHIGGTVRLELTISPKGAVEAVTVLGGNPILGDAAAKAARQWVYSIARSETTLEVTIPFEPRP